MMFALDAAFALGFLALIGGTALLMLTGKEGLAARGFGKVVAYVTIIAAILTLLCTTYYGVRYWVDGYFEYPHGMMMKHGKGKCPMMEGGMGHGSMMEKGMKRGMMKEDMGPGMRQRERMQEMMRRGMEENPDTEESQ